MRLSNQHRPKLLVILSRFPYPLEKGDKLRAFYQIKELSKTFEITLFTLSDSDIKSVYINEVMKYCSKVEIHYLKPLIRLFHLTRALFSELPIQTGYFYSYKARRKIKHLIQVDDYKHIYCQLIRTTEYVKDIHHIPKTLDYMDALSSGIERRIDRQPIYKKWLFKLEAKRLANYERHIFDFFEFRTIISDQDRQLINHPDSDKIHCIPNGIDTYFFEAIKRTEKYDFVFVGNMNYPPNIDVVKYITKHLLPEFPDATLLVSGAEPHNSIVNLANSNSQVTLTGWVDDIRASYTDAKIFLAPMMIGTGMQNKLLEAMAMQTPCITTDLANNAIKAEHNVHILVGNTKEELIEAMKLLLEDHALREKIAKEGQIYVKTNYNWEKSTEKLRGFLEH